MREWAAKLAARLGTWCRRRARTSRGPTATTSPATCARTRRSSRTRPRPGLSSGAAGSRGELNRLEPDPRVQEARRSPDRRPRSDAVRGRAARHAPARTAVGAAAPQRCGGRALPPRTLNHRMLLARPRPPSASEHDCPDGQGAGTTVPQPRRPDDAAPASTEVPPSSDRRWMAGCDSMITESGRPGVPTFGPTSKLRLAVRPVPDQRIRRHLQQCDDAVGGLLP